jgi:hypothetical protein
MTSITNHTQICTTVLCACGRGWAVPGLVSSPFVFRQKLQADGWQISDGGNELYIGADGIQCPVCIGTVTAEEYKASGK